jgi:hypothetical protein
MTQDALSNTGRLHVLDRTFISNYIFDQKDTIVVLGQDGLVANVLKYLSHQTVIGVNPDPKRWEGVLLPFLVKDLPKIVPEVFKKLRPIKEVTMAKAELNTGEVLYGVNDIFIGQKTHVSSRYRIQIGKKFEDHSSSGIIVSTGLGSTGWFRSVLTGATGIVTSAIGKDIKIQKKNGYPWNADYLYFSVREPWPSKISGAEITFGKITPKQPLQLISYMPENGVIFSDGIENDFLQFNSGTHATIKIADKKGHLIM